MTDTFYNGVSVEPVLAPTGKILKLAKSNFDRVRDFMTVMGQEVLTKPEFPSSKVRLLRYALIAEELAELHEADEAGDIVAVADALTDLLYVVYGAGLAYGIDLDACFKEVHDSNMTKVTHDGRVLRNEAGKVLKPDTYRPPNLEKVLGV